MTSHSSPPLQHSASLRVSADHASLPGHFPGQPIAPGVLLLDLVLAEAERWCGKALSVRSLPQVKFLSPLAPEQDAQVQLTLSGDELKFTLSRADALLVQGMFRLA